jgi:hypothetical protein
MEKYMRSIIMGSVLFIAASLLIGCKTIGLKRLGGSYDRGGYAAYENDQKIKSELSAKIKDLELRLKKLEDDKDN